MGEAPRDPVRPTRQAAPPHRPPPAQPSAAAKPEVPSITAEELKRRQAGGDPTFVLFGAPWCGHSKAAAPAWKLMYEAFGATVRQVDCTQDKDLAKQEEIRGFPTYKLFKGDKAQVYSGGRAFADLSKWLRAETSMEPAELTATEIPAAPAAPAIPAVTAEGLKERQAAGKPTFVLFGAPWCGHSKAAGPAWKAMHAAFADVIRQVDCTTDRELAKHEEIKGFPTYKLYHNGETTDYSGARDAKALSEWLRDKTGVEGEPVVLEVKEKPAPPPAPAVTAEELKERQGSGKTTFVLFGAPWCGHSRAAAPAWKELRAEFGDQVRYTDCTTDMELCKQEEIKGFPTYKLFKQGETLAYSADRSAAALSAWLRENT